MMTTEQYQSYRESLLGILNDILEINELPVDAKIFFTDNRRKLQENEFCISLIGEFQGGKSTTFDSLCDGREISPRGNNIKTSSCRISVTNIADESGEHARVTWKSNYELARTIYDVLSFLSAEDFGIKDDECNKFDICAYIDFSNKSHRNLVKKAIEEGWNALGHGFDSENRDILIIAEFIVNFYDSVKENFKNENYTMDEVKSLMTFPKNMMMRFNEGGIKVFQADESLFAFVKSVDCYVHSKALSELGCKLIDCPGLFASRYDTSIALQTISESDATLYLLGGEKQISQSDKKAIAEIARLKTVGCNTQEEKDAALSNVFFAVNQRKSDDETTFVELDRNEITEKGYNVTNLATYNALLFYLATFGKSYLEGQLDESTQANFISKYSKYGTDIESVWTKLIKRTLSSVDVDLQDPVELNEQTISALFEISKAETVLSSIQSYVINKKAESILLTNGACKVEESLGNIEAKLKNKENLALQTTMDHAAIFQNAKDKYNQFVEDVTALLSTSFPDSVVRPLVEHVYNDCLNSTETIDGITLKITKDLMEYMSKTSTRWTAFRSIFGRMFDNNIQENAKAKIIKETEPIFRNAITEYFTPILEKWVDDVKSGSDSQFKTYFTQEINRISVEIEKLWSEVVNDAPLLSSIHINKAPLEPQNLGVNKMHIDYENGDVTDTVTSEAVSLAMTELLHEIIAMTIGFIVTAIVDVFFTFGIALFIGLITEFLYLVNVLDRKEINSKEDLSNNGKKLFDSIKSSITDALKNEKNKNLICYSDNKKSLIAIPESIAEEYRNYYENQMSIRKVELNNEIDEAKSLFKERQDELGAISEAAKTLRTEKILPLKQKIQGFITAVKKDIN